MLKYKAVIFDLDGTAIPALPNGMPTDRLINTLKSKKNALYFSCATGRAWTFAKHVMQALDLKDPCIISAGTQIIDPQTGNVLWQVLIDPLEVTRVIKLLKPYTYEILVNDEYPGDGKPAARRDYNFPINYINVQAVSKTHATNICKKLSAVKGITCTKVHSQTPGRIDLHITHSQATKKHAIHKLCEMLEITTSETIGVGDGLNDLHLFSGVGYKIAMGNAVPELQNQADRIIDTLDNDGLAAFIEELTMENI